MVRRNIKYPLVEKRTYNNKSRKGEYMYVKLGKGQVPGIYKIIDLKAKRKDYINRKQYGIGSKKRGVKRGDTTSKYYSELSKGRKIEDLFGKGYAENEVKDILGISQYKIRKQYTNLLKDKRNLGLKGLKMGSREADEMIRILTQPTNTRKWAIHMEYQFDIMDASGDKIMRITSAHKGKSLYQAVQEINSVIKRGMSIEYERDLGFQDKGYKYDFYKKGTVSNIKLKMIYRK